MTMTDDLVTTPYRLRPHERVRPSWWKPRCSLVRHERPRRADGTVLAGLIGLLLPAYLWIAWHMGVLAAIEEMGGGVVHLSRLGVPGTFTHTDDAISMQTTVGWGPALVSGALLVVSFALGSRIWRLWGGAA